MVLKLSALVETAGTFYMLQPVCRAIFHKTYRLSIFFSNSFSFKFFFQIFFFEFFFKFNCSSGKNWVILHDLASEVH